MAGADRNHDRIGAPSPHLRSLFASLRPAFGADAHPGVGRARRRHTNRRKQTPMKSWIARTLAIGALVLLAAACSPQDVMSYYESIGVHISQADANQVAYNANQFALE